MLNSRIPVRPHVLVAFCLGLGVLGMAVLGLLLAPAQHARAAQTTLDNVTQTTAQGAPSLDALRRHVHEYARQQRGNAPTFAAPSFSPDQAGGQITGRLVAGDTGVANITLGLRRYRPADNLGDIEVLTTTTTVTGAFVFANPPSLPANYAYYVEFVNETNNQNLAYYWASRDIETYAAGQQATVGTLDVANVPLVAPEDNATVTFPVTFQWTPRARTSDRYALFREDLSGDSATSQSFGYVDHVTLTGWTGLRTGEPYFWGVWIDNTAFNGSYGISQRRTITFAEAPAQVTGTATAQTTGTATMSAPAETTGTPTPTGTAGTCLSGTVQVNIQNFAFVPANVTICQGATVRWTNLDTVQHTSTSDTGVWDSGLLSQNQSFSFTFNTIGVYPYHCTPHPNMRGIITVVAGPGATATPTATGTAGATGTATAMMTGTPTVETTGTATAQATAMMTGTPTVEMTGTATAQAMMTATATPTVGTAPGATGTATAMPTAEMTGTATAMPTAEMTGTATAMPTAMMTGTATTQPTVMMTGTATATPTVETAPVVTGTATAMPTAMMTGTATVQPMMTGTATAMPTAMMTGTATAMPTAMMTGTATAMPIAMMTGTATAQATGTATAQATATATATATRQPTGTATVQPTGTATVQPTGTATVQPTGTATPRPTGTAVSCGGGNLCAGVVVVRAFIDFGCDGFFNRGTDYPLYGSTVTATLPNGTRLVSVVDENGNAVLSGINLGVNDSIQVSIDSPPLPTWVQQASLGLAPCGSAPTTVTLQRSNFGLFGVAFTDFRFGLTQR